MQDGIDSHTIDDHKYMTNVDRYDETTKTREEW